MKLIKILTIGQILLGTLGFSQEIKFNADRKGLESNVQKIEVLNFGTFHMGETSDENKTEFDENDKENQKAVHKIAAMLAKFKPTVILVETRPEYDEKLQALYKEYVKNPNMKFKNPNEVELLAYELGRLSGTKRIYGIDHKMSYNYKIAGEINNEIDKEMLYKYYQNPIPFHTNLKVDRDNLSLLNQLKFSNHDLYLDFLITVNADMLTHAGTKKGFEGADEAAKYYQRNLRMYSNLNRVKLTKEDRVFILMGASHTAFFRDFISRSPKYKMVNTFDYLK
ncbi:DUF5694 domain-containing protein [Tenacibaculum jejuense]|uniref:Uncharacterized protein n=1 Tax=Tenacibaculum jejuense TaxID=584609 RepID=A0A238UA89_9FLAO|nr:DUF5694 domain-containing protein [Tenacibaculum jejuense]SNR15478.1 conserved protein of unknown function [Tenacibaculum jejuense]